jgi:putative nucleotidyltransferase with HDIG domain
MRTDDGLTTAPVTIAVPTADTIGAAIDALQWTMNEVAVRNEELERARKNRQATQRLSSALLTKTTVKSLADYLLTELSTLVSADHGSVVLADSTGLHGDVVADVGLPHEARRSKVPLDRSVSGLVMRSGEPAMLSGPAPVARGEGSQRSVQCSIVVPIFFGGKAVGVVNLNRIAGRAAFDRDHIELVATVVSTFSAMFESVRQREQSRHLMLSSIKALVLTIEAKDPYTRGHCERVGAHARCLAKELGLAEQQVEQIEIAATLHDVGKIAVPEAILLKPAALTDEEYAVIKRHPEVGAEIVAPVDLPQMTVEAILYHHERYDGGGYPTGIRGEEIPLGARIVAVVDAFDAMSMTRPYRQAMSTDDAMAELAKCAGTQFCPMVVDAFTRSYGTSQFEASVVAGYERSYNKR